MLPTRYVRCQATKNAVLFFTRVFRRDATNRGRDAATSPCEKKPKAHLFKNVEHFAPTSSYSSHYTEYKDEHPNLIKQGKGIESQEATGKRGYFFRLSPTFFQWSFSDTFSGLFLVRTLSDSCNDLLEYMSYEKAWDEAT